MEQSDAATSCRPHAAPVPVGPIKAEPKDEGQRKLPASYGTQRSRVHDPAHSNNDAESFSLPGTLSGAEEKSLCAISSRAQYACLLYLEMGSVNWTILGVRGTWKGLSVRLDTHLKDLVGLRESFSNE